MNYFEDDLGGCKLSVLDWVCILRFVFEEYRTVRWMFFVKCSFDFQLIFIDNYCKILKNVFHIIETYCQWEYLLPLAINNWILGAGDHRAPSATLSFKISNESIKSDSIQPSRTSSFSWMTILKCIYRVCHNKLNKHSLPRKWRRRIVFACGWIFRFRNIRKR